MIVHIYNVHPGLENAYSQIIAALVSEALGIQFPISEIHHSKSIQFDGVGADITGASLEARQRIKALEIEYIIQIKFS